MYRLSYNVWAFDYSVLFTNCMIRKGPNAIFHYNCQRHIELANDTLHKKFNY